MKRFILLLLTLSLVAGLVYLLASHKKKSIDPLELVPQQAVMMLDWSDAAGAAENFFDSRFGQSLTSIDWPSVLSQLEVSKQVRDQLEQQAAGLMHVLSHPMFKELFSRRMVAALLPVDPAAFAVDPKQAVSEKLIILLNLGYGRFLPRFLSLVSRGGEKTEALSYQGVAVTAFEQDGGSRWYAAFLDGQLVISPGLETVQASIDLSLQHFVQDRTGFVLNREYAALKKRSRRRDDFFFYADLARVKPLVKALRPSMPMGTGRGYPDFAGSERMVIFHHSFKNIQQFSSIVQFDPEQLAPFQKTIYTREPVENRSLLNMPSDLLVYFWSNWLDLSGWWQETLVRATPNEVAAAGRIASWIEARAGMSIDEFLGLFGREFGFNVAEIRTSGFIPVPRICCCIELADRDRVEQLLEKIISGLPVRRDKVAGIPVVSIMAADGLMQPSYALLDRFLVVADSREQIENILRLSSKRLIRDDHFQAVDMGMLQPSNLVAFARTAEIIDGLKEFASWAGTIIAIRDEAAGVKSKVLIDQVLLPLLDGLKMYRAKGVRSYTAPGEVVLDAVVLVADPGAESGIGAAGEIQ